ncbi:putative E3 ubiquitin ligase protein [Dioscorea alata]|uniref:E3 ubiquitin ligase protein n=1 Tax=Dioscorea alata TaxID=55571 RepID=A0ACB7UFC6_DIOAL|nr:putative E3 ubiquitin ligase protein [Dioscorea alata]
MEDARDESRIEGMDLNLYLGLPLSPRPLALDLGSDLALGSISVPSSSSSVAVFAGDRDSTMDIGAAGAAADDLPVPYSPSNASYDVNLPSVDPSIAEHPVAPYSPSYIPIPLMDPSYSPSEVQPLQFSLEEPPNEQMNQDGLASAPGLVDESLVPLASTLQGDNGDEHWNHEDGSSSRGDSLQFPVLRFRRLIESHHRLQLMSFNSSTNLSNGERSDLGWPLPPLPQPPRSMGKDKVVGEGIVTEDSEEDLEEKSKSAADFECNICFEMAKEPVVTSCGHLFCWPCLYQWLYLHSEHKECPVCKGEVLESHITPIFGRGSSEAREESKCGEDGKPGLNIPPRPRGNRVESFRQQMRPITRARRLGEVSWRRLFHDRLMHNADGLGEASVHEIFGIGQRRILARLRGGMVHREEGSAERELNVGEALLPRNSTPDPQNSHTNSPLRDGMGLWQRFSLDLGRVVERLASSTSRYRASVSSANPPNTGPVDGLPHVAVAIAADQASPSSTIAVIQGDVAATDGAAEPNSVGSSSSLRRRGRSSTSGSLDVDGGALHVRKRRRLN